MKFQTDLFLKKKNLTIVFNLIIFKKSKPLEENIPCSRKTVIKSRELIKDDNSAVIAGGSSRNGHLDSEINGRHLATVSDDFRCQQYTFDMLFGVMQEAIDRLMFLDPFRNFYMAVFTLRKN